MTDCIFTLKVRMLLDLHPMFVYRNVDPKHLLVQSYPVLFLTNRPLLIAYTVLL